MAEQRRLLLLMIASDRLTGFEMPLPDVIKGYAVAIGSLFMGASVVHQIFKPDLVGPTANTSCWVHVDG